MHTSPDIQELIAALAQARPQFPRIVRNKTVVVRRRDGGTYTFTYATLDTILDAVCPVLGAHGLAVLCGVATEAGVVRVTTRLAHASGQWLETQISLPQPDTLQELGSLITYVKRYAINALLAIEGETDDDANLADGNAVQPVGQAAAVPGNGEAEAARLTADQARTLKQLAQQALGYAEGERRRRQDLGFEPDEKLTLRHLAAHTTVERYTALVHDYQAALRRAVESDVP